MGMKKSLTGLSQLGDLLQKAGEGSRGGQIIGHTKSGKPIYKKDDKKKKKKPMSQRVMSGLAKLGEVAERVERKGWAGFKS
jgi:hypothetical protein